MKTVLVAIIASFVAAPAMAQSSLGITGAEFVLGVTEDEAGTAQFEGSAIVDVAITDAHGFQGDLRYDETLAGGVGTIGGHLYMTPKQGQKYGLFGSISDVNDRALQYVSLGAEAQLALSFETTVEVQAGIGAATEGDLDYVFGSLALAHALTPSLDLEATFDVAEFDEVSLSTTSYEIGVTATYSPEGAPWGIFASVSHADLTGGDFSGATRVGLGLIWTFGNSGGTDPSSRLFRSVDPVAPLLRRGLW